MANKKKTKKTQVVIPELMILPPEPPLALMSSPRITWIPPHILSHEQIWKDVFVWIAVTSPRKTKSQQCVSIQRVLMLNEVVRTRWDPSFKINGIPRSSSMKRQAKYTAGIANALIDLIIEVFQRYPCRYSHPSEWFAQVILEHEAIGIHAVTKGDTTNTKFKAAFCNANNRLWVAEKSNPFSKPNTKLLFDIALKLDEMSTDFSRYLKSYADARRKFMAYISDSKKGDRQRVYVETDDGGLVRLESGRKKAAVKKVDPETLDSKGV